MGNYLIGWFTTETITELKSCHLCSENCDDICEETYICQACSSEITNMQNDMQEILEQ